MVFYAYENNINVKKNLLPVTIKYDSFEHGIGLANVRNTVEKYHGELIIKTENKKFIADIILYHHENYDGSGYPYCLQGEEIPIGARIIRVCDVFVALISDRAYRKAFEPKIALLMVIDEVRHFDMKVFLAFQRIINTTDILDEVQLILKGSYESRIS